MNGYDLAQTSCSPFKLLTKAWHRFGVWRAMRKYARVTRLRWEAEIEMQEADELMRRHAHDPQARLPLGDD